MLADDDLRECLLIGVCNLSLLHDNVDMLLARFPPAPNVPVPTILYRVFVFVFVFAPPARFFEPFRVRERPVFDE